MSVLGNPAQWSDLLDSMVPDILRLTVAAWESLPPIAGDAHEDHITLDLCKALRQNRDARQLPFKIHTQQAEIQPQPGQGMGRQDIVFDLLVPSEEIYFCLEGKRLNVVTEAGTRSYASEYVNAGMMRFITGQYSRAVRHAGMIGYVLNRDIARAIANVSTNVQALHVALRMAPPGDLVDSEYLTADTRARESHHGRNHDTTLFRIHHLFMAPS